MQDVLTRAAERVGSLAEVARLLGLPLSTVRSWRARGAVPAKRLAEVEAIGDGELTEAPEFPEQRADEPVEITPYTHEIKGVSTFVDREGKIRGQWIKTAAREESREETIARLVRDIPIDVPVRPEPVPAGEPAPDDMMAVYVLGDPHVGMLAWAPETGADWDLRIATKVLVGAVQNLVLRGPRTRRAYILNCGDFFHSDNVHGHTTGGSHSLDLDGRHAKVLPAGVEILIAIVLAALAHHDEVRLDIRIGNHDALLSLMLAIAISHHFRDEPRVSVPLPVKHRSYYEFGKVLIGTTHGDRAKGPKLGTLMAQEEPEAWGRTRHRYWYCGHVHHSRVIEEGGVKIESFRTLAARDSWHAAQGYLSGRDAHRILLHREHGEIGREVVSADALLGVGRGR